MPLTPAHTAAQVTRTLDEIHEWRPVLDPVLHAFAPLLRARADLAAPMAAALEEAKSTVGFDSLGAVKANHVIPVDGSLWTSAGGYLLMDGIVSNIEAQFVPAS